MKVVEHPPECPWHQDWHSCSCGLFDTVKWVDIGPDYKPVTRYCSGEEAAKHMFEIASRRGFEYNTAREAIDDFVALNWAWTE
jgi:hypothetical protein